MLKVSETRSLDMIIKEARIINADSKEAIKKVEENLQKEKSVDLEIFNSESRKVYSTKETWSTSLFIIVK